MANNTNGNSRKDIKSKLSEASLNGVCITTYSFKEFIHSKFIIELEHWLKEDQDQGDVIVKHVLLLVDEEEFYKVKKPRGVLWPKKLG